MPASYLEQYRESGRVLEDIETEFSIEEDGVLEVTYPRQSVFHVLVKVMCDVGVKYNIQKFQSETIFHLVNGRNVLLTSPTGSGKTDLLYLALKVKEELTGLPLVALGSEPTQNILKDKIMNPLLPSATLGMSGTIDASSNSDGESSCSVEDLKLGWAKVIFGYQESWSHATGEEIVESLANTSKVGFIFFDEAHQNLDQFWGGFRPEMSLGPSEMRLQAGRPPVLLMTATATEKDCASLKKLVGIRENVVTIRKSPVMDNIKFYNMRRPSNRRGSGITGEIDDETGEVVSLGVEDGLLSPILQCFLDFWCEDLENEREPKTGIIFSENTEDLVSIQKYLFCRLGDKGRNKPWVLVTSNTGSSTKRRMLLRSEVGDVKLYLATSVLMLGVNFKQVDVVVICRPYPHLHSLLQAAGRGGRKTSDGGRSLVVLYQLLNNEDLVVGRKGMEEETKQYCLFTGCLRNFLKRHFEDNSENDIDWCCSNCS